VVTSGDGTRPPTLADVNELAGHHSDFHIRSFDGHRLVVVGSFDLCYYHYIEVHFVGVDRINCPVWFNSPEFTDERPVTSPGAGVAKPRRFAIRAGDGRHEVIAEGVEVVFGMVYYYDRGEQLRPGERIAEWVKRGVAEPGSVLSRGDS
jgi:hypothetical protein